MPQLKIALTIDTDTGLTAKDIARMIQRETRHVANPKLDVTVTPDTIDIRFDKEFSEIAITGSLFDRLEKAAKENHTTIDKILESGAKRYGL